MMWIAYVLIIVLIVGLVKCCYDSVYRKSNDSFTKDDLEENIKYCEGALDKIKSKTEKPRISPPVHSMLELMMKDPDNFIEKWDGIVHMLMPNQFPCIPNWHFDNIPRVNNEQDWSQVKTHLPMYLWISGEPLTEFRKTGKISPKEWVRFTQKDEHRGTMSEDFQWRGFIRATHKDILPSNPSGSNVLRRHSQVYLDSSNFSW